MENNSAFPGHENEPGHNNAIAKPMSAEYRKNVEFWDNFSKNYDDDIDFAYGYGVRPMGLRRLQGEGRFGKGGGVRLRVRLL